MEQSAESLREKEKCMIVRMQTNCTCCLSAACADMVCCAHYGHTYSAG